MVCLAGMGLQPLSAQKASPEAEYRRIMGQATGYFMEGRLDEVFKCLDAAEKIRPGQKEAKNLKGSVLVRLNKYDEALAVFEEVSAADPNDADAYFNQAECFFLKNSFALAKKFFRTFIGLNKNQQNSVVAAYQIFLCDLMLGNELEVKQALAATQTSLYNPAFYYMHAAQCFKSGRNDEARDYVRSAFRIYSAPLNGAYVDSLVNLGFLRREEVTQRSVSYLAPEARPVEPLQKLDDRSKEVPATGVGGLVPDVGKKKNSDSESR